MKINEVEALAGITKKNIRFYEEQGLLSPKRNSQNGYREYTDEEVQILKKIKILRKLGVPIDEIRQMLNGTHTVADGMRRHQISLEREKRNLEESIILCQELQKQDIPIVLLETEEILMRMEELENGGTSFQNPQSQDVRIRYVAPIIVTIITVIFMFSLCALLVWGYQVSPEDAPPVWFLWMIGGMFVAMGVGAVLALIQRIREIGKREIDDARQY